MVKIGDVVCGQDIGKHLVSNHQHNGITTLEKRLANLEKLVEQLTTENNKLKRKFGILR